LRGQSPTAEISQCQLGSSAQFFGGAPSDYPTGKSVGTYSLDRGSAVGFDIPGRSAAYPVLYQQPYFQVTGLGPGVHELVVTYEGSSAPMVFHDLLVEDGDILQSRLKGEFRAKKASIGAITGGAVGGAVLLIALFALAVIARKRAQARAAAAAAVDLSGFSHGTPLNPPLSDVQEFSPLILSDQSGSSDLRLGQKSDSRRSMLQNQSASGSTFDPFSNYPPPYNAPRLHTNSKTNPINS
jgi:hypothetical protein